MKFSERELRVLATSIYIECLEKELGTISAVGQCASILAVFSSLRVLRNRFWQVVSALNTSKREP